MLDGLYRHQQALANRDKKLQEQTIETELKLQKESNTVWQAQMGIQISTTHSPETKKALDSLSDRARKIQEATANLAKEKEVKDFRIERQKEANKPNGTEDITVSEYDRTEEWLHWNLKFEEKLKLHALLGGSLSEDFDFKRINRFVILPSLVRKELADFLGLVLLNHNSPPEEMALIIKEIRKSPCLESEEKQQKKAEDVAQSLYEKTSTDELVTVATALNSTGFIIPDSPSPNASIQLDMNRVDALKIESKKVTDMLGVLFEQDASSDILMPIQTQVDEPIADNENLLDLDNAHSNLIKLLCSRIQWSRAELEEIASDAGMMLDGALEHINDATYDTFDAALTEGDDPIDINQNILKELLK